MWRSGYKKSLVTAAGLVVAVMFWCVNAYAQCPLCRLSIEKSSQAATQGRGLNLAIIVLLIPPVTMFCSIFFLAFKHRKIRQG